MSTCAFAPRKYIAKSTCGPMGTTIQSIRADLGMAIRKSSTEIIIMHGNLAEPCTTPVTQILALDLNLV
jgi:hypothetical protein